MMKKEDKILNDIIERLTELNEEEKLSLILTLLEPNISKKEILIINLSTS